jgi:hypothetical protein
MDFQTLFNIVLGAFGTLVGWLLNTLYNSMKDLTNADKILADKVQTIEVLVAGNYIPRHEFETKLTAIFHKLDRIEDKIDNNQEKKN